MKIKRNYSLKKFNTYQIDVKAKYFFEIKNKDDLVYVLKWLKKVKVEKSFILAGGSNIIFLDELYEGLIIKMSNKNIFWLENMKVKVGAGEKLNEFLKECQKKEYYKIQSLSGIPGSVGAAVVGNVGAFGQEIKKFVSEVEVYNIKKNIFEIIKNKDLNFSYRHSFFKDHQKKYIIISILFDLSDKFYQKGISQDEYFSLEEFAKKYQIKNLKKENIRINILKIRESIYPDIKKFPNVGSTFKNAEITKTELKKIMIKYPEIPHWKLENGKIKIATAYIFDKILNLRGKVFKNIKIDEKRPLFFINNGRATGKEFKILCQKIKKKVAEKMDIKISEEVVFID